MALKSQLQSRTFWLLALASVSCPASALDWPQQIDGERGTVIIYQPQPESLEGNLLTARAAMSFTLNDASDATFGALWFTATVDTDTANGSAIVRDLAVSEVRWPNSKDAGEQQLSSVVESAAEGHRFEISLEQLSASLATADIQAKSLENINNDPPIIVFREQLAVLVSFDGQPNFSPVENSRYERALNTPVAIARDTRSGTCYLTDGVLWYEASDPLGTWAPTSNPPTDLAGMIPATDQDPGRASSSTLPEIVAATEPTELISTQGKPQWTSLAGGEILYVENTETPWLRELSTGNMYVLLSGRWYRSKEQEGPWTFVRSDELPHSFSRIPPDSDIGGLRASVAGTREAEDAVLDAHIPQTTAIERESASLSVEYDGSPKFEAIPGTNVSYAVNTGAQVLLIEGHYYAVDNGVWFTAKSATGPWAVADSVPKEEIDKIPPSSPVYNTTYVTIYDSTPEVVYVGYTPGYLWSYPYYGVPIYGTGWYYPPYWGRYYYPRPPTWGLHVGYNPWTGWNFGVSWSNGFFSMGVTWGGGYGGGYYPGRCCGGYYGGGFRGGNTIINTGDINIGNNINVGNRTDIGNRIGAERTQVQARQNLYNRPENRQRNASREVARDNLPKARSATDRPNNVYADQVGNIARNNGGQWESREQGQWQSRESYGGANRAGNLDRSRMESFDQSSFESAHRARQHGANRAAGRQFQQRRRR